MSIARHQAGLSLVEMMVGIAIGLIVVAAAAMLVATQLSENRRLLLETQVQQDLRATSDIIAREIRRAGYWTTSRRGAWYQDTPAVVENPYAGVNLVSASEVHLSYSRAVTEAAQGAAVTDSERLGYRLRSGVIETQLGLDNWQALTDGATLRVTELRIELVPVATDRAICPKDCAGLGAPEACWPELTVREVSVFIDGVAVSDAAVRRTVRNRVRLRNDLVTGSCP